MLLNQGIVTPITPAATTIINCSQNATNFDHHRIALVQASRYTLYIEPYMRVKCFTNNTCLGNVSRFQNQFDLLTSKIYWDKSFAMMKKFVSFANLYPCVAFQFPHNS